MFLMMVAAATKVCQGRNEDTVNETDGIVHFICEASDFGPPFDVDFEGLKSEGVNWE